MILRRIILGVYFLAATAAAQSVTPSFDCLKTNTPQEKMICADTDLSKADKHVGDTYTQLLKELPPGEAKRLQKNQKGWITNQRDANCFPGDYFKTCLTEYYRERVTYLDARLKAIHLPKDIQDLGGSYDFKEPHMTGELEFWPSGTATAWGHISTGTEKGTCEFEGSGRLQGKTAVLTNIDTPDCQVQIHFSEKTATVSISGEACHSWCGVHAWLVGRFLKK